LALPSPFSIVANPAIATPSLRRAREPLSASFELQGLLKVPEDAGMVAATAPVPELR